MITIKEIRTTHRRYLVEQWPLSFDAAESAEGPDMRQLEQVTREVVPWLFAYRSAYALNKWVAWLFH